MIKIAIGVLNHNRFNLLNKTLESITKSLENCDSLMIEYVLHDNNSNEDEKILIKENWGHIFSAINWSKENVGIGQGLNSLHLMARGIGAKYYLNLENDWECMSHSSMWLTAAVDILEQNEKIGAVKLRKENDGQYEMWPENIKNGTVENYAPWWMHPIPGYVRSGYIHGRKYFYAQIKKGYTNNPILLKMEMVKDWNFDSSVKGKGKEEEIAELLPAKHGWMTANFEFGIFRHIG